MSSKSCKSTFISQAGRNASGFSLLDVLVALAIFSTGVLAFVQLHTNLVRSGFDARLKTMGSNLAAETMETQRRFTRLEHDSVTNVFAYEDIASGTQTRQLGGINFNITQTVSDFYWDSTSGQFSSTVPAGSQHSDFKRVNLQVSWENPLGFQVEKNATVDNPLGSGDVMVTALISSAVAATHHLALLDDINGDSVSLPLSTGSSILPLDLP